jgi:hypothetical protein
MVPERMRKTLRNVNMEEDKDEDGKNWATFEMQTNAFALKCANGILICLPFCPPLYLARWSKNYP